MDTQQMIAAAQTPIDPFNCPDCGSHDYGLYAPQFGGCPHCMKRELAAVRGQLEESAKTALRYMAQAADETRLKERAESALAAAKAEAEALRDDAERYFYLRNVDGDIAVCKGFDSVDVGSSGVAYTYDHMLTGADLDAAIDAERRGG